MWKPHERSILHKNSVEQAEKYFYCFENISNSKNPGILLKTVCTISTTVETFKDTPACLRFRPKLN